MVFSSQQHHHHHSQDATTTNWSEIQQQQQPPQQEQQQQQNNPRFPLEEQEESYSDLLENHHDNNNGSSMHHNNDLEDDEQDHDDDDDDENPTTAIGATAMIPALAAVAAAAAMVVVDHDYSPSTVMHRIQQLTFALVDALNEERMPILTSLDATSTAANSSTSATSTSNNNNNNTTTSASAATVIKTQFSLHQARSMTSLFLVLSYCFGLLQEGKTTTLREVYYCFVTHFRHQRECCAAIKQATLMLGVPRHALGLTASPRGWYCGDIQILKRTTRDNNNNNGASSGSDDDDDNNDNDDDYKMVLDGRNLQSMHGCPIDAGWLVMPQQLVSTSNHGNNSQDSDSSDNDHDDSHSSSPCLPLFKIETVAATFILVVEKEGIYNRLSEDRFFDTWPCILVTGKGFPDFSTRALVQTLHTQLQLPVYGLVDCNPFGVQILNTYRNHHKDMIDHKKKKKKRQLPIYDDSQQQHEASQGGSHDANDDDNDNDDDDLNDPPENQGVPIQWLGFRPSQLEHLKSSLPAAVFQPLTNIDKKRLYALLSLNEADILDKDDTASNDSNDGNDNDDLASMSSSVLEQQHPWIRQQNASRRRQELQLMLDNNYKVELEALHWLGMDALSEWLGSILEHEQAKQQQHKQQNGEEEQNGLDSDDDDDDERDDTMASNGSSWMDII